VKREGIVTLFSISLVLILTVVSLMLACAPTPTPTPTLTPTLTPTTTPTPEIKPLRLGATMPIGNPYGYNTAKAYSIMVRMFNEAGGLVVKGQRYNIEYTVYDDEWTAEKARSGVERLIYQDGVRHIIGMVTSVGTMAVIAVTEPEKVTLMADCTTDKFLESPNHYTFRTGESPPCHLANMLFIQRTYPNAKIVAIMAPDDEAGHAYVDMDSPRLEQLLGVTVLDPIYYTRGTTDFTSPATKMTTVNPDLVLLLGGEAGTDYGLIAKALYVAGYEGQVIQWEVLDAEAVKSVATDEMLEGLTSRLPPDLALEPNPLVLAFKQEWLKGEEWTQLEFGFTGAFYAFIAAVQKADSLDSDDIWQAMQGLEFESLEGHSIMIKRPDLGIDRFCDCTVPLQFGRVINEELVWKGEVTAEEVIAAVKKVYGGVWD